MTWTAYNHKSISPFEHGAAIGSLSELGLFTPLRIGTCSIRATHRDGKTADTEITVKCQAGPGNLQTLNALYLQRIKKGPFHEDVASGRIGSFFGNMNPGYATNLLSINDSRYADWTCGAYQSKVLKFLHQIQADPAECTSLNGYEFGPIEGSYAAHHAVVVFPEGTDWKTTGIVLDPWYHQKAESFPISVWANVFSPIAGDTTPAYRLEYSTTKDPSDHDQAFWSATAALVNDAYDAPSYLYGLIDCPVSIMFRDSQGRRTGATGSDSLLFEIPDLFLMRLNDPQDGNEWYFRLPYGLNDNLSMDITGTGNGDFEVLTVCPYDGKVRQYDSRPIKTNQKAEMAFDGANPAPALTTPMEDSCAPQNTTFLKHVGL